MTLWPFVKRRRLLEAEARAEKAERAARVLRDGIEQARWRVAMNQQTHDQRIALSLLNQTVELHIEIVR